MTNFIYGLIQDSFTGYFLGLGGWGNLLLSFMVKLLRPLSLITETCTTILFPS